MEALKNNSQAIVRALTVAVAVVLQAITMVLVGRYLHEYASWAYVLLEIISFCLCLVSLMIRSPIVSSGVSSFLFFQ